jgi:hypothetical protein
MDESLFSEYHEKALKSPGMDLLSYSDIPNFIGWLEKHIFEYSFESAMIIFIGLIVFSIILSPFVSGAVAAVVGLLGPFLVFSLLLSTTRYAIFGPLQIKSGEWHKKFWDYLTLFSSIFSMLLLPFYDEIRAALHYYYKRSLVGNFFKNGEDVKIALIRERPYCPFVILTGTSSDYQPPGDDDTISELSFTATHVGSTETGYVADQENRQLGVCAALSGAGCMDAMALSMNQAFTMRFWLEFFNLSWGNFIMFSSYWSQDLKKKGQ